MSSDFEIERRCSYEKKSGIVQLSPTHLMWTPDSAADGQGIRVAFASIRQFQVSKEGSAKKAMIRLTCNDRDNKITLDFGRDFTDRDAIRDVLNKLQAKGANALSAARQSPGASSNGQNGAGGSRYSGAKPAATPKPVSAEERARREKLLARKEVRKLHLKLVRGGAVSDEQFWNAMKYRYKANGEKRATRSGAGDLDDDDEQTTRQTTRGVPSDAFTSGPHCAMDTTTWESTIPTPAQRHLVFMDHPAVARAMAAKVPAEMSEERFWALFLQSSMASRRRGRGPGGRLSKTETTQTAEADAVFAGFQARQGEEEARDTARRVKGLARGLDLDRFDDHRTAHVLEGHVVGGEAPRPLKRAKGAAGAASSNLRLVRQLNRHGTLIVDEGSAGGDGAGNWVDEEETKGRPLDDLEVDEEPRFARLGVGGLAAVSAVGVAGEGGWGGKEAEVARAMRGEMEGWTVDVTRMEDGIPGAAETLSSLLASMRP